MRLAAKLSHSGEGGRLKNYTSVSVHSSFLACMSFAISFIELFLFGHHKATHWRDGFLLPSILCSFSLRPHSKPLIVWYLLWTHFVALEV